MSTAPTNSSQLGLREVLALAPVRRLWLAQVISVFGDFLALFGVLTYASFELHASAAQVSGITIAFMLPFAIVGPLAGVFVDRWNVKRTMIWSDLLRAGLVLLLIPARGLREIYILLFLMSTVSAFFVPAQSVTVRTIVPPNGLIAANALLQQAMQLARIASPAAAAALVGWLGVAACYILDTVSYFASAAMIAAIAIARAPAAPRPGHPVRAVLADLWAGVTFIFTHPILTFVILAMAAGMFAVSCFAPLIAVYVRDILHSTPIVFGIVNAMIGVGMIAGTLVTTKLASRAAKGHLVLFGLVTMGVSVLVLAAIRSIPAAGLGMFGVGIGVVFVFVSASTMVQGLTPIDLVGRVSASLWALLSVAQLLGLVLSGATAQRLGIVNVFIASAAMLVVMAAVGYFGLPRERALAAE
jgi:MFS transporter, DHA3 family, macrolide efflux protein